MELPDKLYSIIYADPAWKYRDKRKNPNTDRPSKYGGISYEVMETKDIKNLPVNKIADKNCMLFLWVTFPNLQVGLDVIKACSLPFPKTKYWSLEVPEFFKVKALSATPPSTVEIVNTPSLAHDNVA